MQLTNVLIYNNYGVHEEFQIKNIIIIIAILPHSYGYSIWLELFD